MRTRSQSRRRRQQQVPSAVVEPIDLKKPFNNQEPPVATMANNRTMAQLLEAPTEGYKEAIVVPDITANNFEIKHELHQLDTFYNALNTTDQDSLNSAAGGNFLDKMPRKCLKIIESKSKVCQSRSKEVIAKVIASSSTPVVSSDVAKLKDMVRALLLDKKNQAPAPVTIKVVEQSCVTCGRAHSYQIIQPPMPTYIMTTSKFTFLKPPRLISIKEIPMPDLRWLQIKSDLPVFLPFKTIKTIKELIKTGTTKEIILTKIRETIVED
uniref:Reverse transcriptase domain-containing protein n=1 Tax=Tanacetum cinerariifolium TaxID=118510 RepID=A0A6L2LCS4_TANCI|nr:hypothetical protein [Tanacetum cinerariifolium]